MNDSSGSRPIRSWEQLSCDRGDCLAHSSDDLSCWLADGSSCFSGEIGLTGRMSDRCSSCPVFTAKRIVTDGGGRIDYESEEGKGTCFTVTLPVWKQPETGRTKTT